MTKKIIIIGGGPAGYEAALSGAAIGGEITLIEAHRIGGTCLNYGCIPTKTLIEHASFYNKTLKNEHMGVQIDAPVLKYDQVLEHKSSVINTLGSGIISKLNKAKIRYVEATGHLLDAGHVEARFEDGTKEVFEGDAVVLATGSKPLVPDFVGVHSDRVLTSKDLLAFEVLPESITIVGGGVIGMEFGSLLSDFGVQITILEYAKHLLPAIDSAIGKRLKSVMSKKGIKVVTSAKVTSFEEVDSGIKTFYEDKKGVQEVTSDYALMAIGRIGSFDETTLKEQGIIHNDRFIQTDEQLMTNVQGIYAIGDVNGKSLLAHAAYDQGRQLMAYLLKDQPIIEKLVPGCVFTSPEIGTVGITEDTAKEQGIIYRTEKTLFSTSGKALAMGETVGFVKTIVDENNQLIGCHVFGPHASDIVHYGSIAMAGHMSIEQLKEIIFSHPTLGELFSDNLQQY